MGQLKIKKYRQLVKKWYKVMKMKESFYKSEEDTMIKIILPFFEMLGWDRLSKNMAFEYPVHDKIRNRKDHVDIALFKHVRRGKIKQKPDILVEVKCIAPPLSRGTQLSKYLKNCKVKWGIFTNGRELKLITSMGRKNHGPQCSIIL